MTELQTPIPEDAGGEPPISEPDEELAARCQRGDGEAFSELVRRYERPLFNAAYRIVGAPEPAAEVTQEALVKAWQSIGTFDTERRFFSWVYRIAVNEALDLVAQRRRSAPLDEDFYERNPKTPPPDPEGLARAHERVEHLHDALQELAMEQRVVIVLKHLRGYSYAEISEILELPEKTVKSRLFEGRRRLRRLLTAS